jgi:Uri superfamily endonuclease
MIYQYRCDAPKFGPRKTIVFTQKNRARCAIQIKYCFAPEPNHVYMSRAMIVRINNHLQSAESQDRWHLQYIITQAFGLFGWSHVNHLRDHR